MVAICTDTCMSLVQTVRSLLLPDFLSADPVASKYELLRRLFHIGNFCFWVRFFKQLLLENCAVDFAEICNVCTRKVIKLLRGYLFLIRFVTVIVISILASLFLEHTVHWCLVDVCGNWRLMAYMRVTSWRVGARRSYGRCWQSVVSVNHSVNVSVLLTGAQPGGAISAMRSSPQSSMEWIVFTE